MLIHEPGDPDPFGRDDGGEQADAFVDVAVDEVVVVAPVLLHLRSGAFQPAADYVVGIGAAISFVATPQSS